MLTLVTRPLTTPPIPRTRLDKLFTDGRYGLRERVLWRMLYETGTWSALHIRPIFREYYGDPVRQAPT
ncbi:hypothetical protein Aros01_06908 [Streptosporangium roseum]|uniref:Uncharacterized protein n=1 Tax=Streptosporangium roseum (strain ATCC 12428 / DSM 43021 / JCM 3005 / KCTC 9067 / NCIMB 10171 / NRRL 2505 / NI 9100) TaxID=479432 RepID=D2B6C9_STRRD|nr:hypothetical protein Sros_2730 [Streptosporangium roseum DSM 43021]